MPARSPAAQSPPPIQREGVPRSPPTPSSAIPQLLPVQSPSVSRSTYSGGAGGTMGWTVAFATMALGSTAAAWAMRSVRR